MLVIIYLIEYTKDIFTFFTFLFYEYNTSNYYSYYY